MMDSSNSLIKSNRKQKLRQSCDKENSSLPRTPAQKDRSIGFLQRKFMGVKRGKNLDQSQSSSILQHQRSSLQ